MFAYCGNNPVNRIDPTGNYHYIMGIDNTNPLAFAQHNYSGGGITCGGSYFTKVDTDFALLEEVSVTQKGAIKTARLFGGSIDAYSISPNELILLEAELSVVSIDIDTDIMELSLFDLGNAGASAGFKRCFPYAEAMVSLWSPSVAIDLGDSTLTLGLHVGAVGAGVSLVPGEYRFSYAKGFGFFITLTD